ncbi:MAG: hypothetical protein IT462_06720 [Planctomycetes bacterium]|nr:hypothetical protein [Planctomycetota bacterium]
MSDRMPIPEIDDAELREHILRLRGLVAEETIETLKMVRLDHIVNPRGKLLEYDQAAFRAWVIAWLNALETVVCAHMAMLTKKLFGGQAAHTIQELVAQPDRLLEQVEDIKRALEIILTVPEMTPEKADTASIKPPAKPQPTPTDEYPMSKT